MPEREPIIQTNPEKLTPKWTPMRINELGESSQVEHGLVFWKPGQIPLGNHLEIDVTSTNRLLKLMNLTRPIEIVPYYNPRREEETPVVTSVSSRGVATAGRAAAIVRKPKNGEIIFDDRLSHPAIAVNFKQIADYIEKRLPDGQNNPKFYERYGREVNSASLRLMGKVIKAHFNLLRKENPEIFNSEILSCSIASASLCWSAVFYLNDVLAGRTHLDEKSIFQEALRVVFWTGLLWPMIDKIPQIFGQQTGILPTGKYEEYLRDLWNEGKFPQLFYPRNLTHYLLIPFLHYQTWNKPLIRGKK